MIKRIKRIKLVDKEVIKQSKWYYNYKTFTLPTIKSYFNKALYCSLYGGLYLLVLRLLGYTLTPINFLSSIALYFILEEWKDYFLKFKK